MAPPIGACLCILYRGVGRSVWRNPVRCPSPIMIEFLIVMLAIGFGIYYMFRHPARSFKVVGGAIGLLALGILGCTVFLILVYGLLRFLL